jgi:biopolymer transport protein ExbD
MAFGGKLDGDDDVMSEINMTPLVDVMLVLLIIFIITVPVLTHSVKLELPRAANQPSIVKPKSVTISITANGEMFWDKTALDEAALVARLKGLSQQNPQPEVRIHGDRRAQYEYVIKAMAAAQRAGILKLGFVTAPGS